MWRREAQDGEEEDEGINVLLGRITLLNKTSSFAGDVPQQVHLYGYSIPPPVLCSDILFLLGTDGQLAGSLAQQYQKHLKVRPLVLITERDIN